MSADYAFNQRLTWISLKRLRLDVGLISPDELLELQQVGSELDLVFQEVLRILRIRRRIFAVLFDV